MMRLLKKSWIALVIAATLCWHGSRLEASEVSSKGRELLTVLDSLHVEKYWIASQHVDWKTGYPDGRTYPTPGAHTHCSAFVAAACMRLRIYIPRPPRYSPVLLANAQCDWLNQHGAEEGWTRLKDCIEAQEHANRGDVVIAAYRSEQDQKSGHIALVRPSEKSDELLVTEGSDVIQAGMENASCTSLKNGFRHHAHALRSIKFFSHRWSPR